MSLLCKQLQVLRNEIERLMHRSVVAGQTVSSEVSFEELSIAAVLYFVFVLYRQYH